MEKVTPTIGTIFTEKTIKRVGVVVNIIKNDRALRLALELLSNGVITEDEFTKGVDEVVADIELSLKSYTKTT